MSATPAQSTESQLSVPSHLVTAVEMYTRRQMRLAHPDGAFDRKGRWYPSESEQRPCCAGIRSPSAAWPHSLNKHCRSVEHVAALTGVEAKALRRAARTA